MNDRKYKPEFKAVVRYAANFVIIQVMFSGLIWVYFGLAEFSFFELQAFKFLVFEIVASFSLALVFLYLVMMQKRVVFVYIIVSAMWLIICMPLIRESFAAISGSTKHSILLLALIGISLVIEWIISFWANWQTIHKKNILNVYPLDKENGMWNLAKAIIKPATSPEETKKRYWNIARITLPVGPILGQVIYHTQSHETGSLLISTMFLGLAYLFIAVSAIPASNAFLVLQIEKVLNTRLRASWKKS